MGNGRSADSPFDSVAETVDEQTLEAFDLLANEVRLASIVALWDAIDTSIPLEEETESGLSFSELRERVGNPDSGNLSYHLNKLTDRFVEKTDGRYTLTMPARRILSAIIAGAVTDAPSFTDEPLDIDCRLCGGSVVIDYSDWVLRVRCTNCDGKPPEPDDPPGTLKTKPRPPAALTNRSPQEFFRAGNVFERHFVLSLLEGICPDCAGNVTATADICDNHESDDGSPCPHCHRSHKIEWSCFCDVCKTGYYASGWAPIITEMAVLSFCYERGLDFYTVYDTDAWEEANLDDAIETTVSARDPLEITVTVELEGDRLTVTLDDDARVIDVDETPT